MRDTKELLIKSLKESKLKDYILGLGNYPYRIRVKKNDNIFRNGGHFAPWAQDYIKDRSSERFNRFIELKRFLDCKENLNIARRLIFQLIDNKSQIASSAVRSINRFGIFVPIPEIIEYALKHKRLMDYCKAENGFPYIGGKDEKLNLYYLREFYKTVDKKNKKILNDFVKKHYKKEVEELDINDEKKEI
jgi:hypothetical protein